MTHSVITISARRQFRKRFHDIPQELPSHYDAPMRRVTLASARHGNRLAEKAGFGREWVL
jgi:hypothetical protein